MTAQQEQQAMKEVYENVPTVTPSEMELFDMFEKFLANQKEQEDVPNLPRGFGQ